MCIYICLSDYFLLDSLPLCASLTVYRSRVGLTHSVTVTTVLSDTGSIRCTADCHTGVNNTLKERRERRGEKRRGEKEERRERRVKAKEEEEKGQSDDDEQQNEDPSVFHQLILVALMLLLHIIHIMHMCWWYMLSRVSCLLPHYTDLYFLHPCLTHFIREGGIRGRRGSSRGGGGGWWWIINDRGTTTTTTTTTLICVIIVITLISITMSSDT